eukprot:TRINITY_DN36049_c0_g1_i1.p1 TRINITY_DN36049_c0_g1~~TRINITY_DN36049_c0_g1_i1.p1  ORF type:complete len:443 (+),score=65.30 TRINITY_DN36049_c0_g1_i1:134-1462(+)
MKPVKTLIRQVTFSSREPYLKLAWSRWRCFNAKNGLPFLVVRWTIFLYWVAATIADGVHSADSGQGDWWFIYLTNWTRVTQCVTFATSVVFSLALVSGFVSLPEPRSSAAAEAPGETHVAAVDIGASVTTPAGKTKEASANKTPATASGISLNDNIAPVASGRDASAATAGSAPPAATSACTGAPQHSHRDDAWCVPRWVCVVVWAGDVLAVVLAVVITILYWGLVYTAALPTPTPSPTLSRIAGDPGGGGDVVTAAGSGGLPPYIGTSVDYYGVNGHGVGAVCALLDWGIGAYPVHFGHVWLGFGYAAAYLAWSGVHWAADVMDPDGNAYIYSALAWNNIPTAVVTCVLGLVLTALVTCILAGLHMMLNAMAQCTGTAQFVSVRRHPQPPATGSAPAAANVQEPSARPDAGDSGSRRGSVRVVPMEDIPGYHELRSPVPAA